MPLVFWLNELFWFFVDLVHDLRHGRRSRTTTQR
jgi:hypothetical protein